MRRRQRGLLQDAQAPLRASRRGSNGTDLEGYARTIGLDTTKFNAALDNHVHKAVIDADDKAGTDAGASGTPAFFVGPYFISGAQGVLEVQEGHRSCARGEAVKRVALVAAVLLVTAEAHAVEKQHHIGLGPTLAILNIDDKSTNSVGGGGAIHWAYGLSDQFNVMFEASSAVVAKDQLQDAPDKPRTRSGRGRSRRIGVGYVIDVLRWCRTCRSPAARTASRADASRAAHHPRPLDRRRLDYQLSHDFAIGIGVREHMMISKLKTYPSYTNFLLRFEYMWGW